MNPIPGQPPCKPKWIICDTDALLQLISVDRLGLLKILKGKHGIQSVIVASVETELRRRIASNKFRDVSHVLNKALKSGLLPVLTAELVRPIYQEQSNTVFDNIEARGETLYNMGVGLGEAYSHAAGIELGAPVLSNDRDALDVLANNNVLPQGPFLRSFDILVFARQIGYLSDNECDESRQSLISRGESLDRCFTGKSFVDGVLGFYARLVDGHFPIIGSVKPVNRYDQSRITLW